MAVLQFLLKLLVLSPIRRQRLVGRLALEDAASALDQRRGDGLEQDAIGSGLDDAFGAVLDLKLFPEPSGDDDLTLGGEPDGVSLVCRAHPE